jgi:hypothetical protein
MTGGEKQASVIHLALHVAFLSYFIGPFLSKRFASLFEENHMRVSTPVALLSLLAVAVSPVRAQSVGAADDSVRVVADTAHPARDSSVATPTSVAGAPANGLRAGVHARETQRASQPAVAVAGRAGLGQSQAMMVVGVGALIAGAIIGDTPGTIIMVGGAVIGLIGLYQYLQ